MPEDVPNLAAGDLVVKLLLLIGLILINGFFSMSEIAVISFNDAKLRHLAQGGNKKAQALLRLTSEPSRFLATIQVGLTLAGLLSSAVAVDAFSAYVVAWLTALNVSHSIAQLIAIILITFLLTYLTLVFGELVPKRLGMQNPEKISFRVSGILRITNLFLRPFVALSSASTNFVLRLLGINPKSATNDVTEEEIRMMIDVGEEEGTIDDSEREMLHNIFEFDDRSAADVMTHRTEIVALDIESSLEDVIKAATDSGYSRLPVHQDHPDNIIGVIYIKDLLKLTLAQPANFEVREYIRPVIYLPESARCNEIFEEFRHAKVQLAVIVDEYGGTAGLVTMEDLLETIVGNIQDEYDEEPETVVQLSDGEYLLDGGADIEEVSERLDIQLEDSGYETIAGFVTSQLRRLPKPGEYIECAGFRFTVTGTDAHRITQIGALRLDTDTTESETEKDQ